MPKPVIAYSDRARLFFRRLAEPSGNAEFTAAMKRTADALSPIRRREPTLLPDADSELRHLDELLGSRIQLRRAISSYHRRRQAILPQLVGVANF